MGAERSVLGKHLTAVCHRGEPPVGEGVQLGRHLEAAAGGDVLCQGAVDLVGTYLQEAAVGAHASAGKCPDGAGGVEEGLRAQYIGLHEHPGAGDAAVYVALGGEVDDIVGVKLLQQPPHQGAVADVAAHKAHLAALHLGGDGGEVACIRQRVEHEHRYLARMGTEEVFHKVGADKSCAAGH